MNDLLKYIKLARDAGCGIWFSHGISEKYRNEVEIKISCYKSRMAAAKTIPIEAIETFPGEDLIELCVKQMIEEVC